MDLFYREMKAFINRAEEAGAFGETGIAGVTYLSCNKVGCGFLVCDVPVYGGIKQVPVLTGFYSECPPNEFLSSMRKVAHQICQETRKRGYTEVWASLDHENKNFGRLLRFYQRVLKFEIIGEHGPGYILRTTLEHLEDF